MNLQYVIAEYISRGEQWLERQHESGRYFGLVHYEDDYPPESLEPGIQPTAAAAHYWAWSAAMNVGRDRGHLRHAKVAGDWLLSYWDDNGRRLPSAPGSDKEYFYDVGCAARALFAVYRATGNEVYADASVQMVARMSSYADTAYSGRFHAVLDIPGVVTYMDPEAPPPSNGRPEWQRTFGAHQRKAAVALRLFNRPLYDVFDIAVIDNNLYGNPVPIEDLPLAAAYFREDPKTRPAVHSTKLAKELKEFNRRSEEVRPQEPVCVRCQVEAYSAEALVVGQYSQQRAREVIDQLGLLMAQSPILRTDAYGQWVRLRLLTGAKQSFPLIDIERLCQAQRSSGGWRTYMANPEEAAFEECSVEATVIALQTLGIYADRSEKTAFPNGPLGKRELVII